MEDEILRIAKLDYDIAQARARALADAYHAEPLSTAIAKMHFAAMEVARDRYRRLTAVTEAIRVLTEGK